MTRQILAQVDLEFSTKMQDKTYREQSTRMSLASLLEIAARRVMDSETIQMPEKGRLTLAVETEHFDSVLVLDIVESKD